MDEVQVHLLCGGLGTRLRPAQTLPKAIVPVAGRPFVVYVLRALFRQGFPRVHFLLGFGANEVRAAFPELARLSGFDPAVFTWTEESCALGTGGAIAGARLSAFDLNLVLNADSFVQADLRALLSLHRAQGGDGLSLLAVRQAERAAYGGVELDAADRVIAFLEKGTTGPGWINGGVYALSRGFFAELPTGAWSLERELLPRLASEHRLRAVRSDGFFCDIGTPERLSRAQDEFRRYDAWFEGPAP